MTNNTRHRPGPGWKCIAASVWEHASGLRMHVLGMARLSDGRWVDGFKWPESRTVARFVRMNGGNRRRGLMAWAISRESE